LEALALDNQLEAKFATGWLQHKVLAGVDYQWSTADATYGNGTALTNPVNISYLNPNYGSVREPALTNTINQKRTQLGIYAQDQIRLANWAFVVGVRNDQADATSDTRLLSTGALTNHATPSDSATTWRAGATYLFENGLAPYFSYATSFEPTVGTDYTGQAFAPTTGEQYEAGLKYQPLWINGFFMVSFFDLTQQNVLTPDTAHTAAGFPRCTASGPNCQIQAGEVHSKGVELSAKLTPIAGLNLTASYSHTDIEITRSTQISVQGKVPVGAPSDAGAFWVDYTFQSGPLAGFGLGGGVRYVGSSYGDNINSAGMVVPAYTLYDAALHYDLAGMSPQLNGWKLALNVTNVFDMQYVSACNSATQCFWGNGRSILGTVRYQW
ncbi:MAG: TonB-dependent siderophore receptor, partial [Pseudorhodoplanes sp.]